MRNCRRVKRKLDAYANGALRARASGAIEAHLSACPRCNKEYLAAKGVEELVRTTMRDSDVPLSWETLKPLIREEAARDKSAPGWARIRERAANGITHVLFPAVAPRLSATFFYVRRSLVPALGILIAFSIYSYFPHMKSPLSTAVISDLRSHGEDIVSLKKSSLPAQAGGLAASRKQMTIKVVFGPAEIGLERGNCYTDSGGGFSAGWGPQGTLYYGWK